MSSRSSRSSRRTQVTSSAFRRQLRFETFEARNLLAVYEVSSLDDAGVGSLRQAVLDANTSAGDDSIVFNLSGTTPQTITLNSQINITDNVTIDGTTFTPGIKVSGGNSTRLFSVANAVSFTIDTLTLADGASPSSGAAIQNSGTTTINRSTVTGNQSFDDSGAIANFAVLVISNSTFSGNSTNNDGGAIRSNGTLTISNSTFSKNHAGVAGGAIRNDGTLTISNSIVSGNTANQFGPDLFGTIVSDGYNLVESTNSLTVTGATTGNILGQSALLGPLGDYGGPTQTHPISANSPAFNSGDPLLSSVDQRGQSRVGQADIGAFESEANRWFVTSTSDSGVGSLRQSIVDGNTYTGADKVYFSIPTADAGYSSGTGTWTIAVTSALPAITESLHIDGTTQSSFTSHPIIELRGDSAGTGVSGLTITDGGSTIEGLVINRFDGTGVFINGNSASGNVIRGNYIGTDVTGFVDLGNGVNGIEIVSASNNIIGGVTSADRNIISGNNLNGVKILLGDGNTIIGNYVGLGADGTTTMGNANNGLYGVFTANTTIGGSTASTRNVVSGNGASGIVLDTGAGAVVTGNYVGLTSDGTAARMNAGAGVTASDMSNARIGGTNVGERNVVVSNTVGISASSNTPGTQILGNYVGTDFTGTVGLSSGGSGVLVYFTSDVTVGGSSAAARNVIMQGPNSDGIFLQNSSDITIQGNYIGTDVTGMTTTASLANRGIILAASSALIGTDGDGTNDATEGNVIAGASINVDLQGLAGSVVAGNLIGTNVLGTSILGSSSLGIRDESAGSNQIGTNSDGTSDVLERNIIAGAATGIFAAAPNTLIAGNYIGSNVTGTEPLPNGTGIDIVGSNITVGGTASLARNLISASSGDGVRIRNATATNNSVLGNYIGTDVTGTKLNGTEIYESFNYSNGDLLGRVGGQSFSGAWGDYSSGDNGFTIQSGLTYPGLSTSGGSAGDLPTLFNDGNSRLYDSATYNSLVNRGEFWFSFLYNVSNGYFSVNPFVAFTGINNVGRMELSDGGGIFLTGGAWSGDTVEGATVPLGQNVWIVGKLTVTGLSDDGTNDRMEMWVNPTPGVVPNNSTRVIDANFAFSAPVNSGLIVQTNGTPTLSFDEYRVSANYPGIDFGNAVGVSIQNGASSNTIGGTTTAARNLISGNSGSGVEIIGSSTLVYSDDFNGYFGGNQNLTQPGTGLALSYAGNLPGWNKAGFNAVHAINQGGGNFAPNFFHTDSISLASAIAANDVGLSYSVSLDIGPTVYSDLDQATLATDGIVVEILRSDNSVLATETILSGTWVTGPGAHALSNRTFSYTGDGTGDVRVKISTNNPGSNRFGGAIDNLQIREAVTHNNVISGNYIGTNVDGSTAIGNGTGIAVFGSAPNNTIGGTTSSARNLISGNGRGMDSSGAGAGTTIQGNYFGVNASGTTPLPNYTIGNNAIDVAGRGTIGGLTPIPGTGAGNLFGGVVQLTGESTVLGNTFGLQVDGTTILDVAVSATQSSSGIRSEAAGSTIGGTLSGSRNVFAGYGAANFNGNSYLDIMFGGTNTVQGNFFGTDKTGLLNRNTGDVRGIQTVFGASENIVGGPTADARNVIVGGTRGFETYEPGNTFEGNYVGIAADGVTAYGMSQVGVFIRDNNNTIRANVISGSSTVAGLRLEDTTTGTIVAGNLIGTDASGTLARPNLIGISVGTSGNIIGGPNAVDRNVISGNVDYGLRFDFGSTDNTVQGNLVGVKIDGSTSLLNGAGALNVSTNATLKGTGLFTGNVVNQGSISPGNSPGIITINGDYTQSAGAALDIELEGTNAATPEFDQLIVNGTVVLNGTLNLILLGGYVPSQGNSFKIIDNDGSDAIVGTFSGLAEGATITLGGNELSISYVGGSGNDVVLTNLSTTYYVTTTNDAGAGSLRQALLDTNAHPGLDRIAFNIATSDPNYDSLATSWTIAPAAALPTITEAVHIDGTTQPGFTNRPVIEVRGDGAGPSVSGFTITSSASVLEGLAINRFTGAGVTITGSGAMGNVVIGNYIGLDVLGAADQGNSGDGILVSGGASNNTIGGLIHGARNVISGNNGNGIEFNDADNNIIIGNYVGLNALGTARVGNTLNGVLIQNASSNNRIGTDGDGVNDASERNVISGNASGLTANINILGSGTMNNVVAGNFIGTTADGQSGLTNSGRGIRIATNATFNRIGTDGSNDAFNASERNVISGHSGVAVYVVGGSNDNVVAGNYIGLNATGTVAIGNNLEGVSIELVARTRVGTNADGIADAIEANVIGASGSWGMQVANASTLNSISGNRIGTNADGSAVIPNTRGGLLMGANATFNTIGGTVAGAGNLISGNTGPGVSIVRTYLGVTYPASPNNTVAGNFIGTDISGTLDLGNSGPGIYVEEPNTTIGGITAASRNVIGGNDTEGIVITGSFATGITVSGNYIGVNESGSAAIPNRHGLLLSNGATNNTIGGTMIGTRNVISGNDRGIMIDSVSGNFVQGNFIGTDSTGLQSLGNAVGVEIKGFGAPVAFGNVIGGVVAGAGNIIGGNGVGIALEGDGATNNTIAGNIIGLAVDGSTIVANVNGVQINGSYSNTIGGTTEAARNVISGNSNSAVFLNYGAYQNTISGNYIGTDSTGMFARPNSEIAIFVNGPSNTIGGVVLGAGNVISGNGKEGVFINDSHQFTVIAGNIIGLNASGDAAIGNGRYGIVIGGNVHNTTIGGTTGQARNIISGNALDGIYLNSANVIEGTIGLWNSNSTTSTVNGLTGTLINGAAILTQGKGQSRTVFNFDGVDDYFSIPDAPLLRPTSMTADGWFNFDSVTAGDGARVLFSKTIGSGFLDSFGLWFDGSNLRAEISDGTNVSQAVKAFTPIVGQRYHLAMSFDDAVDELKLYIDRIEAASITTGLSIAYDSHPVLLGADIESENPSHHFAGRIDDFAIYGRALSAAEIAKIVAIGGGSKTSNSVIGNYIGTSADGTVDLGNSGSGIRIGSNSSGNLIGGAATGAGNLISGNNGYGVFLDSVSNTVIQGNLIGTNALGTAPIGNAFDGINGYSFETRIGGSSIGAGNVISGNLRSGIDIGGDSNTIAGNFIGTNKDGTDAIQNAQNGISSYSNNSLIGGFTAVERNIIVAPSSGVSLNSSFNTRISGNYIGTDVTGTRVLASGNPTGVTMFGHVAASDITIGGGEPGAGNVINVGTVGNGLGVHIQHVGGSNNKVQGNFIGTDPTGSFKVGNNWGVLVDWQNGIVIGTDSNGVNDATEGNVISGNVNGIMFGGFGGGTITGTVIAGNKIGTDKDGKKVIGNSNDGMQLNSYGSTRVGTNSDGVNDVNESNVIAGSGRAGVWFSGDNTLIAGNYIGTDNNRELTLTNSYGIIAAAGSGHTIGGSTAASKNYIYNSSNTGLRLEGNTSQVGSILNNFFALNNNLAIDAGNSGITLNEDETDDVLNYPVVTSTTIVGSDLIVEGFVGAGRTIQLFTSGAALNAIGQGLSLLATLTEGSVDDLDVSTGSYGPTVNGRIVSIGSVASNAFRFQMPIPSGVSYGSALTALSLGSTSEFSPIFFVGDVGSSLAPQISLDATTITTTAQDSIEIAGSFYDPDSDSWTATVDYGDGSGAQPLDLESDRSFLLRHSYATNGTYTITVHITDETSVSTLRTINVSVQNEAPTASFDLFEITSPAVEGQLIQLTGQFEDTSGSYSATIDWGDGSTSTLTQAFSSAGQITSLGNNKFEIRATHVYRDDFNPSGSATESDVYRVVVTVSDGAGIDVTPTGLFLEEIRNALPSNLQVNLSSSSISEGQVVSLSGSFLDPGLDDSHKLVVDWGDGTQTLVDLPASSNALRSFTGLPALQHVYANDQTVGDDQYTITVSVADDDQPNSPVVMESLLSVSNVVPMGLTLSANSLTIQENGLILLSGSFVDPGLLDSHSVSINWGDGSSTTNLKLPAGQGAFTGIKHFYADNSASGLYNITVSVADKDTPLSTTATLPIQVLNALPLVGNVTIAGIGAPVSEGDELTITGSYTDESPMDTHQVSVSWGDNTSSLATVDPTTRTFTATHRYRDNGAIGLVYSGPGPHPTGHYLAEIVVTVTDDDGASTSTAQLQRVDNVAPSLLVQPSTNNNDPNLIQLAAQSSDLGDFDSVAISWQAYPAGILGAPVQTGSGSSFSVDRTSYPNSVWRVRVEATDDDGGSFVYETALLIGTAANDNIAINDATFTSAGVSKLLVMGLGGNDVIDGTQVAAAGNQLILDGGDGTDNLFGGVGNDIYYLWRGNDKANVPIVSGPTPVELGSDTYKLKPNSELTVIDRSGDNTLDFGLADYGDNSGITFDLQIANSTSLTQQDVSLTQPSLHFVSTLGSFNSLVGSNFGDRLTAASNSTVSSGAGSDILNVKSGTTGAVISGGADDDRLTTTGVDIANLNFGGDEGTDSLINLGSITGLTFRGGADDDVLTNEGVVLALLNFGGDDGVDQLFNEGTIASLEFNGGADEDLLQNRGSVTGSLNFGGDEGVDAFLNAGSIASLTFQGGADDDVFVNNGATPTTLSFIGDDDILLSGLGTIGVMNFGGDDGADVFVNLSTITTLTFSGGADDDLFVNHGTATTTLNFGGDDDQLVGLGAIGSLSFQGDSGLDELRNLGTIADLTFGGGADDDLLANSGTITTSLNFGGDDGIDGLFNTGSIAALTFVGGADDDILINNGPVSTTIHFGGDDDVLTGLGTIATLNFGGDDGADLLVNLGSAGTINFAGGADDDRFVNAGTLVTSLSFAGDDDILVSGTATVTTLNFGGDDGADLVQNSGTISDLTFGGGADDDIIVNQGVILGTLTFGGDDDLLVSVSGVATLSFSGDSGSDSLVNIASIGTVNFFGGADDDLIRNSGSITGQLNFGGDEGADALINTGLLSGVVFNGGADDDTLANVGEILSSLSFGGDDGADSLQNSGTITSLTFGGGADDDLLVNRGTITGGLIFGGDDDILIGPSSVSLIHFVGDQGADTLVNLGSAGSVQFTGGADSDRLENSGSVIGALNFQGDEGADSLINRGAVGSISFTGGADDDILLNNSTMTSLTFIGGADDDVLSNHGSLIGLINFQGDGGDDVLINNGGGISTLTFAGGADDDVLVSNGKGLGSIVFNGDSGSLVVGQTSRDTMIVRGSGNASLTSSVLFEGGYDSDAFENNAGGFATITFLGGADGDAMLNNANTLNSLSFVGDNGEDVLVNHGDTISSLVFTGGADDDVLVNDGDSIVTLNFSGGADEDLLVNSGHQISAIDFSGGADDDIIVNSGNSLGSLNFSGGADDDLLINDGAFISTIQFGGDQGLPVGQSGGNDRLWNRKTGVGIGSIVYTGDDGADVLVNDAVQIGAIDFTGDSGSDALQNNGQVTALVFAGGADDDFLVNSGSLGTVEFAGGADDDTLVNRGTLIGSIDFQGDGGADLLVNGGVVDSILFTGGADNDTLQNSAQVTTLSFLGDEGADTLVNNAEMATLNFSGGADDDLLQNNATVSALVFVGGADSDLLINNGNDIASIDFGGDEGADTLINNGNDLVQLTFVGGADSDTLRVSGTNIDSVNFTGGADADSFTFNAVGTTTSTVEFYGDHGDDFFAMRGAANSILFRGGQGNDQVMIIGSGTMDINGQEGNDRYTFVSNPIADVTISEAYSGSGDLSADTFDFSSFTGGAAILDLRKVALWQSQGTGQLRLALADDMSIENVIGTSFADTIYGNPRSNYIGGADFDQPFLGPIAAPRGVTQWVLLDFDTYTNTNVADLETGTIDNGEYVYSSSDRQAIRQRVEAVYRGPNVGAPWFDVRVVTSLAEIPLEYLTNGQFATIFFNRTPTSGRPGGLASEIDPGNVNLNGYAFTQVNGLLGGVVSIADTLAAVQPEDDSEGGKHGSGCNCAICKGLLLDIAAGDSKPDATRENFVLLSSKIAAHELGHLLGLRHQDAFGPIGSGLHDPPGASGYAPVYTGPAGGFETFDHIIGSPASIGSNRFNDLNDLFFGEREAIKLAFAGSDSNVTTRLETSSSHGALETADLISPVSLAVPNTLSRGVNQSKDFFVQIASINGQIEIDSSTGRSQSDWYAFNGSAGELINIDLFSNSVSRFGTGVGGELTSDDFVDSIVRVWYVVEGVPQLIPYYNGLAENDDTFEPTDSSIVDLRLPSNGLYYIEVDTFNRYGDVLGDPQNPISPLNPLNPNNTLSDAERVARFSDSVNDTDTGKYQLLMFKFRKASSSDGIDDLKGFGGTDTIAGGVGEDYVLSYSLGSAVTIEEGTTFARSVTVFDPAASNWSLSTVDYGDGTGAQPLVVNASGVFELNHRYDDNGSYTITVTVVDDIGQTLTQTLDISAQNIAPTATLLGSAIVYGDSATASLNGAFDVSSSDTVAGIRYAFALNAGDLTSVTYASSSNDNNAILNGLVVGEHTLYARVLDKDGGYTQYTSTINVLPRLLTVTADSKTKIYGDTDPSLTFAFGALYNGDTASVFTGALSRTAGENVGTYTINQGSLAAGSNYTIAYAGADLAITPKSLTVSANARTKLYGDTDPTLTYIYSPLANGDTSSVFVGSLARTTGENVGNYNILQNTLSAGANYTVNYVGTLFTISAAPLTITADSKSKLVGQADPALTYQVSGLKFSDTASSVVSGSLSRQPGETAGVYNILPGTIATNANYSLVYVSNTLTITGSIANNPPTVSISTPTDGFMNLASTFVFTATDPDAVDQSGVYTYLINWGNGATTTVTGSRTKSVSYAYPNVSSRGQFQITVQVTDPRGAASSLATKAFVVSGWTLMADPVNAGKAILVLVGSQGSDNIKLKLRDDDYYKVRIVDRDEDIQRRGTVHGNVDRILVFAYAGNDKVTIDDDICETAEIWGGSGDDDIKGGSGSDIILGEAGDDNLWGGDGRDIVIGGLGADRIHGDANDDILIAGFTMYEASFATSAPAAFGSTTSLTLEQQRTALEAVLAEWTSNRSYSTRRQNILGTGTGPRNNGTYFFKTSNSNMTQNTVFDDAAVDRLWGDSGTDWFFANTLGDLGNVLDDIRDRNGSELTEDLDKWW